MATIQDNYETGADSSQAFLSTSHLCQSFTASSAYTIIGIGVKLYRDTINPLPGVITVTLYLADNSTNKPTGGALATGTTNGNTLTQDTNGEWRLILFDSDYVITNGEEYVIVLKGGNAFNSFWIGDHSSPSYAGGQSGISNDSGSTWGMDSSRDRYFRTYDGSILDSGTAPTDKKYSKQLVAIGNNEVWRETSPGTMSEVTEATADIDTSNPLTVTEAFQKLFIANETNLKVLDFINTKITTGNIGAHPPDSGTILTSTATGNPSMVVDYITTLSGTCVIYGKRITAVTFGNSETVEGTDDDSNAISFTTSAAETAPPHWYDWTVFGNNSTFGTMPDSAYLVCRYRGRLVLSGNSNYPHQWYMSKVGFPFNFLYGSTDPLTAVAGNNVDAGEVGDIVRALIPFGDDFMIFGCANSIHLLDGDPAHGGSIDELDSKTGIFGPWAWCIDGIGDLWFYGTGGLYKMTGGRSRPINISQAHLPKLVTNWAAVPGTHRVVLTYDPFRNGIIISRTTLSSGANLNYWYDLKTEGFYPETYPNDCGVFSSHYYDSDSIGTKGLILGCTDGYLRNFYDTKKDDDSTVINSYVTWPIEHLAEDDDKEGKLTSLTVELAGGASGGSFGDTNEVSYKLYKGNDAETVLEKVKAETAWATGQVYVVGDLVVYSSIEYRCITAHTSDETGPPYEEPNTNTTDWETVTFASGTLSGVGRKNRIRTRIRGAWLGIKFFNSTATETWAINRVYGTINETGKIK